MNMLMNIVRLVLLAMAALCLGTGLAWADCRMSILLVMPVTMSGTKPMVTVELDGMQAHMVMDTGSFFSFLTPEAAKRAGLDVGVAPANLRVEGIGGVADVGRVTVRNFVIGKQNLHRADFLVYGDRFSANGVDGVLGQNILRITDNIEIDLANGVVRLMKTTGCANANEAYWAGSTPVGMLRIPYTTLAQPQVIADAQVNGTDIRVMFDTGANFSNLSLHAAAKAGITPQSPGVTPGGLTFGFGNAERDSWIAPFRSFKLDLEETRNTHLRIGQLSGLPDNVDMLLGADFFLSHRIFIDYGERKLFFTYNGGPVFDLSVHQTPAAASAPAAAVANEANGVANAADADRRGAAAVARGDLAAAIADFGLAIAAEPNNAQYLLHRAQAEARAGEAPQGLADLETALRLQPNLTDALMLRASYRMRNNNLDGARADFAAAEASAPERFELPLEEASLYASTERYPMALELLDSWIAAHSRDDRVADARAERCLVRGMLGRDLDAALADCNSAKREASSNYEVLYSRGIVQLRRKEYVKAVADLSDTIERQPRFARALYARGLAKMGQGDRMGGEADLQAALAIDPRVARVFRDVDLGP
jgi:tetratricopeptide (TPR) repeat protein